MSPDIHLPRGVDDPPPGSLTAWLAGCTCPRAANHDGAGAAHIPGTPIPVFYFNPGCPLHYDMEQRLEEVVGREWIERWYAVQQEMDKNALQTCQAPPVPGDRILGLRTIWHWLRRHLFIQVRDAEN